MQKNSQTAQISYFLGPGWKKFGEFIKQFWRLNQKDIKKRAKKVETGKGVMTFSGLGSLMSCISLILFGTVFFFIITVTVSLILGTAFLGVYILIIVIWGIDRLTLITKGIFVACPNCKSKYLIPTYMSKLWRKTH